MFKNYVTIAFRTMRKNSGYSLINITGLAVGIAACLLILMYVQFERSFDDVLLAEDIYRVENNYIRYGELIYESAATFSGVGPEMKDHFPEVVDFARLYYSSAGNTTVLTYNESGREPVQFTEEHVFFTDPAFIDLFDVDFIHGDPSTVLRAPEEVLLSRSAAARYFGDANPVGRVIRLNDTELNEHALTVVGVFEDAPPNSHVHYDVLISYVTLYARDSVERYENDWGGYWYYTYVLLAPGTDPQKIEAGMPALVDRHKPDYMETNGRGERIRRNEFTLRPLREIHLSSNHKNEIAVNGNGTAVSLLFIVAVFILVIAWVNYINLATARSIIRAREVGVRKAVGSSKRQLVVQFLFESTSLNLIAFAVALWLAYAAQPLFNQITGRTFSLVQWDDPVLWLSILSMFTAGALLSGLYPAFVLSGYKTVNALKGGFVDGRHRAGLRKGLVVFQFVASLALITSTFAVYQQLQFMQRQDLGFDVDQIVIVEKPGVLDADPTARRERADRFEEALLGHSAIQRVAASSIIPGRGIHRGLVVTRARADSPENMTAIERVEVDRGFLETYGMELLAGRTFSEERKESDAVVLNRSAVESLEFESAEAAVGEDVFLFGRQRHTVIGVIEDYHHESLDLAPDPMYFVLTPTIDSYFSIKLDMRNVSEALTHVASSFEEAFPDNPFSYYFLDAFFDAQYEADRRFVRLFAFFAALAVLVACLGLFSLSAFMVAQRTKEIGIRKSLGASAADILALLSKNFIQLVFVAGMVAFPVAYYGLNKWLQGYAFHIEVDVWLFVFPLLCMMGVVLVTIGSHTVKAALANPVKALRYE